MGTQRIIQKARLAIARIRQKAADVITLATWYVAPKPKEIRPLAKKGCRKCNGRGMTGTIVSTGAPVVCSCVRWLGIMAGNLVERKDNPDGSVSWIKPSETKQSNS